MPITAKVQNPFKYLILEVPDGYIVDLFMFQDERRVTVDDRFGDRRVFPTRREAFQFVVDLARGGELALPAQPNRCPNCGALTSKRGTCNSTCGREWAAKRKWGGA